MNEDLEGKTGIHVELPDRASDLIRLALSDLRKIEESRKFYVDMSDWFVPEDPEVRENPKCGVCFAGAIMAQTINCDPDVNLSPYDLKQLSFGDRSKLAALDDLRNGNVPAGLNRGKAFLDVDDVAPVFGAYSHLNRDIPKYNAHDPEPFHNAMKELAMDMAEARL